MAFVPPNLQRNDERTQQLERDCLRVSGWAQSDGSTETLREACWVRRFR